MVDDEEQEGRPLDAPDPGHPADGNAAGDGSGGGASDRGDMREAIDDAPQGSASDPRGEDSSFAAFGAFLDERDGDNGAQDDPAAPRSTSHARDLEKPADDCDLADSHIVIDENVQETLQPLFEPCAVSGGDDGEAAEGRALRGNSADEVQSEARRAAATKIPRRVPVVEMCEGEDERVALDKLAALSEGSIWKGLDIPQFPVPHLTPCRREIPPGDEDSFGGLQLRDRYAPLTKPLPLLGALAMRPAADGGVHLVEELRSRVPWHRDAIAQIERQLELALWAGRPWLQWRPLVLAGLPGVGKSHLARLIGTLSGIPVRTINAGGTDDVRMLAGTARGWRSAQPCFPAVVMNDTQVANSLIVVEEIDKVDGVRGSAVFDALLQMVEPATARSYFDSCLLTDVDMSAVLWVMTANDVTRLPAPLLSRVDVAFVRNVRATEVPLLIDSCLDEIAADLGVPRAALPALPPRMVALLGRVYLRRRSVRRLRKLIGDVVAGLLPPPPRAH